MATKQRTTTAPDPVPSGVLTGVLDAAAEHTRTAALAEAARFELAATWAEAHPPPPRTSSIRWWTRPGR